MKEKIILSVSILIVICICISCYLFDYRSDVKDTNQYSIALSASDEEVSERDRIDKYCAYLGQYNEEIFVNDAGMDLAEAVVEYNEELDQYSIALSLVSDEAVSEEQIASFRTVLEKQEFAEIALMVNGEIR